MLDSEKTNKFIPNKEHSKGEWKEITEIYRKNEKKRKKHAVIQC